MRRLGRQRSWGERRGSRAPALLLLAPVLVWSCGGSSEKSSSNAGGTSTSGGGSGKAGSSTAAGAATSQGGSAAGGNGSQGGSNGGLAPGGGGQATAGTPETQAGAAGAGQAGAGGAAAPWDPELLGFKCDSSRCTVGQACIRCIVGATTSRICVPNPSGDPTGFATATAACDQVPQIFDECDGPEDCPGTKYCVAAESENGFMRCRNEPSSATGSCCFACGAPTDCTLCRSAADCPDDVACEPAQSAPAGIMGCRRRP